MGVDRGGQADVQTVEHADPLTKTYFVFYPFINSLTFLEIHLFAFPI